MKLIYGAGDRQVNTQAPLSDADLVNKKYVDDQIVLHSANTSIHLTSAQNAWLDAITATSTEVNRLSGVSGNVQTLLDSKLSLAGGALTGMLVLSDNPTLNFHAATKLYVDSGLDTKLNLTGGTLSGYLNLHATPVGDNHASTKKYVDDTVTSHASNNGLHVTPSQKTFLNELAVTSTQVNHLVGVTTGVQTQLDSKLNLAGGTLTGMLTLASAPTADLHAATKKYTDDQIATRLELAGGTMTGFLTLNAAPTNPMHAVTKQYVDAIAMGLSVKASIRLATTANLPSTYNNGTAGVNATLTGTVNATLVVDSKPVIAGDRILVRAQTNPAENGDYVVVQTGDAGTPFILKRAITVDQSSEVPGSYFHVYDGVVNKGTGWVFTVADPSTFVIGTDAITVNQFSGPGGMIGDQGVSIVGNVVSVKVVNTGRLVTSSAGLDLAVCSTAGTYKSVTVDSYGRVTGGTNPTTVAGYGITDGVTISQLNAEIDALKAQIAELHAYIISRM